MVQDAETIEKETKNENDDFIKTVIKFNEIYTAALEQNKNKSTLMNYLMTYLAGNNVSIFDDGLKIEDIFIDDDYLFDSSNEQETKNICDYVVNDIDQTNFLFEDLPKPEFVARDKHLEKLSTKIKPSKRFKRLSEKVKEKYQKQRQKRGAMKKLAKKP